MSAFNDLKLSRKYRYIIYSLSPDNTQIVVEHTAEPGVATVDAFNEFREKLPPADCRYAVFDFEFEKQDGSGKRNKICFVSWYVPFILCLPLSLVPVGQWAVLIMWIYADDM